MDLQRLVGEVARRHNVLVDPSDPIFVAVTLNEILLAEHVRKIEKALDQANRSIAAASTLEVEKAKRIAAQYIAQGAQHSADQVRAVGLVIRAELEAAIAGSIRAARDSASAAARDRALAVRAAMVTAACAALVVAMAASVWVHGR